MNFSARASSSAITIPKTYIPAITTPAVPAVYIPAVPAVYGDTRTGATIDVRSSGKVGLEFGYAIDSGSVDTTALFRATAKLVGEVPEGAKLSRVQAEAIGAMRLIQLVGLEVEKLAAEFPLYPEAA